MLTRKRRYLLFFFGSFMFNLILATILACCPVKITPDSIQAPIDIVKSSPSIDSPIEENAKIKDCLTECLRSRQAEARAMEAIQADCTVVCINSTPLLNDSEE
jgi:hypothetical protein